MCKYLKFKESYNEIANCSKITACTRIWAICELIIKPDFAVFSCLSMILICVQPCLKGYPLT